MIIQRGTEQPDLMGHLIANTSDTKKGNNLFFTESRVIISAERSKVPFLVSQTSVVSV